MEIKAIDGRLSLASMFGPVAVGYAIGAGVIMVPMFLLFGLFMSLVPAGVDQNVQPFNPAIVVIPMMIMVPFIVAMQSVMMSGFVMLGLAIYRNWGPLRISAVRETPED